MNGIYQKSLKTNVKKISFTVQQFTSEFVIQILTKSFLSLLSKVDMKYVVHVERLVVESVMFCGKLIKAKKQSQ